MDNLYGIKELEQVTIKTTYPIEINGRKIEIGETILEFDKIQIGGLQENTHRTSARGGWDNREHIFWETTKEMDLYFSQGVFSLAQLAIITNSKMFNIDGAINSTIINTKEEVESSEEGKISLKEIPVGNVFVYDKQTGEKLAYTLEGKEITIKPYTDVLIRYSFNYSNHVKAIKIGNRALNCFLELEGRTRLKDDKTGHTVTGIVKIPKLKLMSDLSIMLGENATPSVLTFTAAGIPVGNRGNSHVCEMIILSNDIDSDIR